ncbi:MAG: Rne/Rng family ribonuclease, partial [Nostocoides sp.]
ASDAAASVDAEALGDSPATDGVESAPAPRKRPRKATTSGQPSGTAELPAEDGLADDLSAEAADEADSEPAPPARRKAATKATRTKADSRRATSDEPEPEPEPELVDEEELDETDGDAAATPATNFGLLFQAPDLAAAPTRRRATRPAAAPEPVAPPAPGADHRDEPAADPDDEHGTDDEMSGEGRAEFESAAARRRRRRGGKGRRGRGPEGEDTTDGESGGHAVAEDSASGPVDDAGDEDDEGSSASSRRRRRRRRSGTGSGESDDPPGTVTKVREPRARDEVTGVKGSTRLEAKKQRRREGREAGRRRTIITESEFLARRESVERIMVVREKDSRTQIAVLEDNVLVEHYVSRETNGSMAGNIYLGRVQNVLPSMEAAFVDIGKGRNAVLYAGEVNWDAAGLENNQPKRIEHALKSGDSVLVQVTKDPIGHKGARLTSQISLPGRYLVYVPEGSMTGISRKLPDTERTRLKAILKQVVPDTAGVIVRTAAEGASEEELRADVERLTQAWDTIRTKTDSAQGKKGSGGAPLLVHGEPDLTVRVIRDIFNEDFVSLVVQGDQAWEEVRSYVQDVAPDLADRVSTWTAEGDVFTTHRVHEQLAKAMDRKVWLPSGGSLVIDRTEAMTVVDVNTGKFVGSGGNLEETVTKNNIEAAEEIVRQLRLRDIGGIIVIDFIDMVLESNRDLVVRRLLECLGRDRTKHQVAEVTSLGLVQMTRKRVGSGLIEVFSDPCEHCHGRGIVIHSEPIERGPESADHGGSHQHSGHAGGGSNTGSSGNVRGTSAARRGREDNRRTELPAAPSQPAHNGPTAAQIAAAAHAAAMKVLTVPGPGVAQDEPTEIVHEGESDAFTTAQLHSYERDESAGGPEPVAEPERAAYVPSPVAVTPRPRRKRGRVVAPAGPPRHPDSAGLENPSTDR